MKARATITLAVAAVSSSLVWVLSPLLTGHAEPWDADGPYFISALAIAGAASGGLSPKPLWAHYVGAISGQAAFELSFLSVGPLFLVGVPFLFGYSIVFLAAAAVAAFVRIRCMSGPNAT
jgi:hypothetical protein